MNNSVGVAILVGLGLVLVYLQGRVFLRDDGPEVDRDSDASKSSTMGVHGTHVSTEESTSATPEPTPTDDSARPASSGSGLASRLTAVLPVGVGIGFLGTGVTVWLRPEIVPSTVTRTVTTIGDKPETPLFVLGGLLGLVTFLIVTFGSRPETQQTIASLEASRTVRQTTAPTSGSILDATVEEAIDTEHSSLGPDQRALKDHLETVAVESLITYRGWSEARAVEAVERGTWTNSAAVAAFLGGDAAPSVPLLVRVLDWLSADSAYERQVRRTIAELETLRSGDDT